MYITCHTDFTPEFICAESARADDLSMSVCVRLYDVWAGMNNISLWDVVYSCRSQFFSLKASLESADFILTSRCPLEVISVTVAYVTQIVIVETVRFVCDIIRAVRTAAFYLLDCLFRC